MLELGDIVVVPQPGMRPAPARTWTQVSENLPAIIVEIHEGHVAKPPAPGFPQETFVYYRVMFFDHNILYWYKEDYVERYGNITPSR